MDMESVNNQKAVGQTKIDNQKGTGKAKIYRDAEGRGNTLPRIRR